MKFPPILIVLTISTFLFCGCPAELKIIANNDGTYSAKFIANFQESLIDALESLLTNLSQVSNQDGANAKLNLSQIIDAQDIQKELNSHYFSESKVQIQENSAKKSINFIANFQIKNTAILPKNVLSQSKAQDGKTRLMFTISPENLQETFFNDAKTLKMFADILLAPLINGEEMSVSEYRELLTEIYGEKVASELLSSEFKITLTCPNGKNLSQTIPVAELLASSLPISFVFEY